jgi:hypothetical protein
MLYFFHRRNSLNGKMLCFYNRLKHMAATEAERCAKAQEVHAAAVDIRNSLRDFKGNEFVNYYLHCAIAHLPDQIRGSVVDVFDASGCALEHLHKDVKKSLL